MTVIKVKDRETRTILDLSGQRYSKNKIKQLLRSLEVESWGRRSDDNSILFIDNQIKIGIFTIYINLALEDGRHKLKDFQAGMSIVIHEKGQSPAKQLRWRENILFKNQYWLAYDTMGQFKIKHLVDAIYHCQRLNNLKVFL
jgi:hypothetical protein